VNVPNPNSSHSKKRPPATGKLRPKSKLKSKPAKLRWLGFGLGLTGIATLAATAGAMLAVALTSTPLMQRKLSPQEAAIFSKGERISSNSSLQVPELTRPVNIMVLGVKVLTTDTENAPPELKKLGYQALVNSFEGLTDTMLMVRFNPETKKLAVLSIPRDTRTQIPGHRVAKINSANALGGPALAAKATSDVLGGVGIDRYVSINVQGVKALVDALGGVNVYVPKNMKYRDDSQHLYIDLKAGRQHLNGDQALQLLRFRYDEYGDIGRIQRQQMVMRALMEQTLNPATLARLPKLLSVVQTHVDTNLSVEELMALAGFASQVNRSNVQMLTIPGDFSQPGQYDASYWLPNPSKIATVMARYFDFGSPNTASANGGAALRISLEDSTKQPNAALTLSSKLTTIGYPNVAIVNPVSEPLRVTRIIAQKGDADNAEGIRQALGFGEVRVESTGDLDSDITIQIGQDWVQQQPKAPVPATTR
jgi:polyisoprenyl-teichoic acid--peptidoglycan teichoic acid transferase